MNAVTNTTTKPKLNLRIMFSSTLLRDAVVVACAALLLAAAFPKIGAAWLVPFGTAALFWTWQGASWKRALLLGWIFGIIFFALDFAWVGHTVARYIGVFGPYLAFGPALIEAPFIAIAGALGALAYARMRPDVAPLGAAAAFTVAEWLRSIGVLAMPFDQLGYTQAETPLRVLAAYAGTYGITFVLCVFGAYLADGVHRRKWRSFVIATVTLALATLAAWIAWPARSLATPSIRVAAVQGNIAQSFKWNSLRLAVERYSLMTETASLRKPRLIVWPETVITTDLNGDPALLYRFENLAREAHATIVAGSLRWTRRRLYNALYVFSPNGTYLTYDKRELVPFAEWFPGRRFLWWLPYVASLNGGLSAGRVNGVYPTTALPIAPLICWESAFADLAYTQVRAGAQLLVISTDDAWFGTTSGPYMHAQIAQLRAIESGAYVVRAAATGISGIIAPDGTWQRRSRLDSQTIVDGSVAPRAPTVFSRIGPLRIIAALAAFYAILLVFGRTPGREQPTP
ncbi:MAG: apolipoprotein N-acyltransferase [Candidatus Eremiobacteraeota bacterium]|nr:apolipoprotein N-acyltransferase [Candidatus Eremiobacteraeota bacterium]